MGTVAFVFTFYPKAGSSIKASIETGNTAVAVFTDTLCWNGDRR